MAGDKESRDSGWHLLARHLLHATLNWHLRNRDDFYLGASNLVCSQSDLAQHNGFRGPDFYFVNGVPREPLRPLWCSWQENGRLPDVIIELSSAATAAEDRGVKKDTYERLGVDEYFCYEPNARLLEGWRLGATHRYTPIDPDPRGWLWSEELELRLGTWTGRFEGYNATWLRFYELDGSLVPTVAEAQAAEIARLRAMLEPHKPLEGAAT